jgi:hypothetical protein
MQSLSILSIGFLTSQTSLTHNYKKNIASKLSIALNTGKRGVALIFYMWNMEGWRWKELKQLFLFQKPIILDLIWVHINFHYIFSKTLFYNDSTISLIPRTHHHIFYKCNHCVKKKIGKCSVKRAETIILIFSKNDVYKTE